MPKRHESARAGETTAARSPVQQKLPAGRGRHGLSPEEVAENHRNRLIAGLGVAMVEKGYEDTTVQDILDRSGVSRRTFYQHFANKDECFLAAARIAWDVMREYTLIAFNDPAPWPERVEGALETGLDLLSRRPVEARLWLVENLEGGPERRERYDEGVRHFAEFIHQGNELSSIDLPIEVAEQVIGGIISLVQRKIAAGEAERLGELRPAVCYIALSPYLGPEEAWRLAAGEQGE